MARDPIPVVLLPGLEGTGRLFARFLLSRPDVLDLRVVSYPPDRSLGYAELADHVRAVLPRRGRFVLLGESFSGPLALRIARERPRGLSGIVLAASFHRRPAPPWLERLRPLGRVFFAAPLPAHAVRLLLGGAEAPPELVREVQEAVASVSWRVMLRRARAALEVDASDELRACPVPLLVLSGRADRLLRREIPAEILALRADADVRMLEAPHLVLQSAPSEAMAALEAFARRVAGPAAAEAEPSRSPSPDTRRNGP